MAHITDSSGAHPDAVIIGGGIHGCSTALHLALRGLSVTLLEKDYVGRHASGVNAGGVRQLGRHAAEIPLSMASAQSWHTIEALLDDDCAFTPSGQIKVAESDAELKQLKQRVTMLEQLGFEHEQLIDRKTLLELVPEVSPHCLGGLIVEGDGHANPIQTMQAFRSKCLQQGVRFREQSMVDSSSRKSGIWQVQTYGQQTLESPILINCAGAWGGKIAAMLGETIPVEARAPMLMITERIQPFVGPVVGAQGRTLSFKQFANGSVMIGGGHEGYVLPVSNKTRLDYAGLATNARTAVDIFPNMHKVQVVRCWAGIEGMMPDAIPVIGPSQAEGAFHAFGFSAHGFQLGPISGKILSDLVIDGTTKLPITPFRANRFVEKVK